MFACSYGAAFGAIQQIPQIVPAVPDVRAQSRRSDRRSLDEAAAAKRAGEIVQDDRRASYARFRSGAGWSAGLLLAILVTMIVSRRWLIRVFLLPGLIVLPMVFGYAVHAEPGLACKSASFLVGLFTVGPVQLLGQLFAARVSDPPARHGRELRREHRRADDRHVVRLGDDQRCCC